MAEVPENIMMRFVTKEVNAAGIYLMTFFVNGHETPVVVDDFIPTKGGRIVFAGTKEKELWPILLEKAWAKLHGTYARTEGGLPSFACMHLMGTPSQSFYHGDMIEEADKFWAKLREFDRLNY